MPHPETPPPSPSKNTTNNTINMSTKVNGEVPSSAFLSVRHSLPPLHRTVQYIAPLKYSTNPPQHLASFPLISDSITTFKTNPYGAKSLDLTTASLQRLEPLLPYLAKPYQYVSPYVQKADSLGDSTLSTIETRFPLVKKPTGELYSEGRDIVFFPLKKGTEGKEYVIGVFGSEKKKAGQEGLVGYGKALIGTGFIVGGEAYKLVSGYLAGSKKEVNEVVSEKPLN